MKKLIEFLNHERYQVIAAGICLFLLLYGVSCESRVTSMHNPAERVTRDELTAEMNAIIEKAELKYKALDRQDELKALLYEKFMLWTQTGVFNPLGILPAIFTVLGVGAVVDNTRYRKANKKNSANNANKTKDGDA